MRFIKDYLADMFFNIKDMLREDKYMRRYLYASIVWTVGSIWASIHFGLGWLGALLMPIGTEVMYFIARTLRRWDEQYVVGTEVVYFVTRTRKRWDEQYAEQKKKDDAIMELFEQELDDWGTGR